MAGRSNHHKRESKNEVDTMTPEEEKAVADKRKLVDVFRSELMKKVDVSAFILIVAYARTSLSLSHT